MNNNTMQSKQEACTSCEEAIAPVPTLPSNTLLDLRETDHSSHPAAQTSSAPALSPADEVPILLPRSKSLNSSLGSCLIFSSEPPTRTANLSLCGSRLLQREARLFGGEGDSGDFQASETAEEEALVRIVDNLPNLRIGQKAMIWTEKEALRKQVTLFSNSGRLEISCLGCPTGHQCLRSHVPGECAPCSRGGLPPAPPPRGSGHQAAKAGLKSPRLSPLSVSSRLQPPRPRGWRSKRFTEDRHPVLPVPQKICCHRRLACPLDNRWLCSHPDSQRAAVCAEARGPGG